MFNIPNLPFDIRSQVGYQNNQLNNQTVNVYNELIIRGRFQLLMVVILAFILFIFASILYFKVKNNGRREPR